MDDPSDHAGDGGDDRGCKRNTLGVILIRCAFTVIFTLTASFFFSFLFGFVAIAVGSFSNSSAVLVPTVCRIVSSGVDLRSSKVCELDASNYRGKNAFYSLDKTTVRCRDDYYWASIFKVEYKDHFSGRKLNAVAEAPREALPIDCRPTFSTAWMTKSRFKVNETYRCRYTPGTHKADIYSDDLFNCQAKGPSMPEMVKRFFILCLRSLNAFSLDKVKSGRAMLNVVAGIVTGMLCSLCLAIMTKIAYMFKSSLVRKGGFGKYYALFAVYFRRGCLLAAYISATGWLMLNYSKVIGLKQLLFDSNRGEQAMSR